jgi:uncharacterized RDD family membrane protein YckC
MTNLNDPAPRYTADQQSYQGPARAGGNAPWAQRALGMLVDAALVAPGWLLYAVGAAVGGVGALLMLLGFLVAVGAGLYLVYLEGTTGQSIGKRKVGIRLISEQTGRPIGFGPAVLRKVCHVADSAICYVGWLWPLWDDKQQTLADKIVGTVVVTDR